MKEIGLLIASIVITIIIVPIGILYNIGKSIAECYKLGLIEGSIKFVNYWLNIVRQLWVVVRYAAYHLAMINDYQWNVFVGEAIEDVVAKKEDTLYGKGGVSVSQATGKEELEGNMTKFGKSKFVPLLNWFFKEPNHSIDAYKRYLDENRT